MSAVATVTEPIARPMERDVPMPSTKSIHEEKAAVSALQKLLTLPTETLKKFVPGDIPDMGWM